MEATHSEGAGTAVQTMEGAHTGGRAGVDSTEGQKTHCRTVSHGRTHHPQHPQVCSGVRVAPQLTEGQVVMELGSLMAMGLQDPAQQDQLVAHEPEAGGCSDCEDRTARGPVPAQASQGGSRMQQPDLWAAKSDRSVPSKEVQDNDQRPRGSGPSKKWPSLSRF